MIDHKESSRVKLESWRLTA